MPKIILLPGNSAGNRQSIDEMQALIGGDALYYQHWETGEPSINLDREVERLSALAEGNVINVFAKSAGTLLAMKAFLEAGVRIQKAVFLGTPVHWAMERNIPVEAWLKEWHVPTLFIHKEHDPVISTAELSVLLNDEHELVILPGNDHHYNELDEYMAKIEEMLA